MFVFIDFQRHLISPSNRIEVSTIILLLDCWGSKIIKFQHRTVFGLQSDRFHARNKLAEIKLSV